MAQVSQLLYAVGEDPHLFGTHAVEALLVLCPCQFLTSRKSGPRTRHLRQHHAWRGDFPGVCLIDGPQTS